MTLSWNSIDRPGSGSSTGRAARGVARPLLRAEVASARSGPTWRRLRAGLKLRLEIKKLGQKIDAAIARREADEPQAPYWGLSGDEREAVLAELRAWVEQIDLVQYRGYFAKLSLCCPSHPDAVIELSTVMAAGRRTYGNPASRPLQDALVWNDKWRVASWVGWRYQMRRLRLPSGEAVTPGAITSALFLTACEGPRHTSPAAGAFVCLLVRVRPGAPPSTRPGAPPSTRSGAPPWT